MADRPENTTVAPSVMEKDEIIEWWKKSAQEVGSDIEDLRMSKTSNITMFWLFVLFGGFLIIALPTVNTAIEAWVTILSMIVFAAVAAWALWGWKRAKAKLAEAEVGSSQP